MRYVRGRLQEEALVKDGRMVAGPESEMSDSKGDQLGVLQSFHDQYEIDLTRLGNLLGQLRSR